MNARKTTLALFALALGLSLASFAGASPDAPAVPPAAGETPPAAEKACCKHHEAAGEKTGMHCDHARMKAGSEEGKACCAEHAAKHKDGAAADGKAACAHHAGMKKNAAPGHAGDAKACHARHAAMHKDGDKSGCCCCGGGEACAHHAPEAPAKS